MARPRIAGVGGLTAIAVMVVATAAGTAPVAPPPEPETIEAGVDRLFARWQRPDSPGCSVGVSRGVTTVLERGYGTASLEHGVPITPASCTTGVDPATINWSACSRGSAASGRSRAIATPTTTAATCCWPRW